MLLVFFFLEAFPSFLGRFSSNLSLQYEQQDFDHVACVEIGSSAASYISPTQCGLVPGRVIRDNLLLI